MIQADYCLVDSIGAQEVAAGSAGYVWGEVVLGAAVLAVVPFLSGSARSEAGSPPAVSSGSVFAVGALLVVTLAAAFYATVKASDALARRTAPVTLWPVTL
ncbi:hypothetical protein ACIQWN_22795 [Streptomyces vinaceus]|uniref:hypothetical protein n=1 Tax=Streptomyces vinaceus TaxID=1960 RepID=UPI0037FA6E57